MSAAGIAVWSSKDVPFFNSVEMVSSASAMGTLVKRLIMSKLIIRSSFVTGVSLTRFTKSVEFLMNELVFPTSEERILVSILANW